MRKRNKRIRKAPAIWRTADHREIPVREMGDLHLYNTLQLIERRIQSPSDNHPRMEDNNLALYGALVIEAIRRGLYEWAMDRKYLTANAKHVARELRDRTKNPSRIVIRPKYGKLLTRIDELTAPRRVV